MNRRNMFYRQVLFVLKTKVSLVNKIRILDRRKSFPGRSSGVSQNPRRTDVLSPDLETRRSRKIAFRPRRSRETELYNGGNTFGEQTEKKMRQLIVIFESKY